MFWALLAVAAVATISLTWFGLRLSRDDDVDRLHDRARELRDAEEALRRIHDERN